MARPLPKRRLPHRRVTVRRIPLHRAHGGAIKPLRTSDLVLALLGVVLLGGLALAAAFNLAAA